MLQVIEDSKAIIDRALGLTSLNILALDHWIKGSKVLISIFQDIAFKHIHREFNDIADDLSKLTFGEIDGFLHYEGFMEDLMTDEDVFYAL